MKKYNVTVNGETFLVEVEEVKASAVELAPSAPATTPSPAPTATPVSISADDTVIKCPIPGVVLKICCSVGQFVKAGDVLLIIEAMKMENEIMAPTDGIIKRITVSIGAAVQTDDILVAM